MGGGYILTNNHVIAIAANEAQWRCCSPTGRPFPRRSPAATRRPTWPSSTDTAPELPVIAMGTSSTVKVGEATVVLGAPLGLSGTVTSGIVSALDRTVGPRRRRQNGAAGRGDPDRRLHQSWQQRRRHDQLRGQLIGVPTAGATVPSPSGESSGGSIGLGFAIPVDLAKTISDEIIATGSVTHAYFGLGDRTDTAGGRRGGRRTPRAFVESVAPGGPAAQAGIRQGDVITKINGEAATGTVQLQELTLTRPGETVKLEYWRRPDGHGHHHPRHPAVTRFSASPGPACRGSASAVVTLAWVIQGSS